MTSTLAKYVAVLKMQLVPLGLITSEYQSAFYTIINKYYTEIVNKVRNVMTVHPLVPRTARDYLHFDVEFLETAQIERCSVTRDSAATNASNRRIQRDP